MQVYSDFNAHLIPYFCSRNMVLSNIHSIKINSETEVFLLSYDSFIIEDYLDSLTEKEILKLNSIGHKTRKEEFVATRILRTEIAGKKEIQYSEIGAPFFNDREFISISHTTEIVGIAISTYKVGFDLEPIRDKAKKLKSKFLHYDEMSTSWSLKESLYKLAGRKKIIFKDDLRLTKNEKDWSGIIYNENETIHSKMKTFHSGNNVLTINSEPIEVK
jgi:4'-phosphopantetheinyl transferase